MRRERTALRLGDRAAHIKRVCVVSALHCGLETWLLISNFKNTLSSLSRVAELPRWVLDRSSLHFAPDLDMFRIFNI